jgi:hypothetical protein
MDIGPENELSGVGREKKGFLRISIEGYAYPWRPHSGGHTDIPTLE